MRIKEIQNWERNFSRKKGINFKKNEQIKIAILKLTEEVGEVSKAILENRWNEIQAEISDVIIFACKIANIAEDIYKTDKLEDVLKRKMKYCEIRTFDKKSKKFNKPTNKEFK